MEEERSWENLQDSPTVEPGNLLSDLLDVKTFLAGGGRDELHDFSVDSVDGRGGAEKRSARVLRR